LRCYRPFFNVYHTAVNGLAKCFIVQHTPKELYAHGLLQGNDMAPALAAGFFLAAKQGAVAASVENMRMVMAGCVVAIAAANFLVRREVNHGVCFCIYNPARRRCEAGM
jgi:hypothetical protein